MSVLSAAQVTQLAASAGFSGADLAVAVAVAHAESYFDTAATNHNSNGTYDYGLWQINTVNGYDPAQLVSSPSYNARAAYQIYVSWNRTFQAWTTFNSGAYKAFLSSSPSNANPGMQKVQSGTSNSYPKGQCTWWADFRYNQVAGYLVPWSANAKDWSSLAAQYGWTVSDTPHVPSIMVLQPSVQGSDPTFGHVAVVERMNTDGSVYTSAQNVSHVQLVNGVAYLSYKAGPGVSFVYAGSGTTNQTLSSQASGNGNAAAPSFTPVLQQVHNTLVAVPGFEGIAYAVDELQQYPGWIDLRSPNDPSLFGFDVVGWTRSVGASIASNSIPLAFRSGLMGFGALIILFLMIRIIFGLGSSAINTAEKLAPLAALAA